jgi:hypothetical protein
MTELSTFTRRRLERIANEALRRAGVLGVVPTPLDAVAEAAAIAIEPVASLGPERDRPLLGAMWLEERTLFLERRQSPARRRFTQAHELMHALCPWHGPALRTDTAAELFGPTREMLEAEANAGASLLIFGGTRATGAISMSSAQALAAAHGASLHATLHHGVEADRGACALLVAGRFPDREGALPVWRSIESPAFRRRFSALVPRRLAAGSALRELAEQARLTREPPPLRLTLGGRRFVAEAHDNRHAVFVLLRPHETPAAGGGHGRDLATTRACACGGEG